MSSRLMVFHCPFPVKRSALQSANTARPVHMLEGFKAAGFRVIQVTGNARQRWTRIRRLKRLMRRGLTVDFAYSETSNLPLFFNEKHRLPVHPFMENRLFRWLRRNRIPTGLFLRDLHWRFPHFRHYPLYKRLPAVVFYWLDWLLYMSRCDQLFVPSLGLVDYLPTRPRRAGITVLPPGCEGKEDLPPAAAGKPGNDRRGLSLFYVGGLTPPLYNLRPIFNCARQLPQEKVTICCRQDEWLVARPMYAEEPSENVHIVHAQGAELAGYYRNADLFLFTLEPYAYMKLAMPYKVFEAVSYQVPILTFAGSEAARWIEAEDAGWVVQDLPGLISLIEKLRESPALLRRKAAHLGSLSRKHSWKNRALEAAAALVRKSRA